MPTTLKQIVFLLLLSLLLSLPGLNSLAANSGGSPNILMIVIDDQNDWVGAMDTHPQVQTPNIDALAARGTLFTNAHCQSPLCNPSRTSFMTGRRPSSTGIYGLAPWFRNVPALKNLTTLPQHFANHGYKTYTTGKIYHGKSWNSGPVEEFHVQGTPASSGLRPKAKRVATPRGGPGMDWGLYPYKDSDQTDYKTASYGESALTKIIPNSGANSGASADKPFFLAVGFQLPHVPLRATQKWFDLYPEDEVILPPMQVGDRDDTPRFSWYLHWKLPEPRQKFLIEAGESIKIVQSYLACISFMDSQVGRVLDALEKSGQADNTIVVLFSDHGYHLGQKEITGKNTLWDPSTRVPLIFAGPGVTANSKSPRPAELLDIYPTLCDLTQTTPPVDQLQGLSLLPQLKNPLAPRDRPAITTHNHDNHSVRSERYRFTQYADGSQELYDMINDPNEFTNLINDPAHASAISNLKQYLPTTNLQPAPGSAKRILTYKNGVANWEGEDIPEGAPIPD